jgi:CDGSH-type Zn-finger protein
MFCWGSKEKPMIIDEAAPKNPVKIKILKNGPYLVSGSIPLSEKIIISRDDHQEYRHVRDLPLLAEYSLCRCGHSRKAPYCDGSHLKTGFVGRETASRNDYAQRAERLAGPELDLLDDSRCAYARFCHRPAGSAWDLTENSDDPHLRREAIQAACECPSGRLVAMDKAGNPLEPVYKPAIEILQDDDQAVSGPLFVKGNIPIESEDGYIYERRNRITLCRCGQSENLPFCDASHISAGYQDHVPE